MLLTPKRGKIKENKTSLKQQGQCELDIIQHETKSVTAEIRNLFDTIILLFILI